MQLDIYQLMGLKNNFNNLINYLKPPQIQT
jgi:hypothetical protein